MKYYAGDYRDGGGREFVERCVLSRFLPVRACTQTVDWSYTVLYKFFEILLFFFVGDVKFGVIRAK